MMMKQYNVIIIVLNIFLSTCVKADQLYEPFQKCELVRKNAGECAGGCVYAGITEPFGCCGFGCECDWCEPVGFGWNSPADNHSGFPCEIGFFSNIDNAQTCQPCQPGSYAPQKGSSSCELCSAGYYQNSTASQNCIPCPPGTYNSDIGQSFCHPCSPGYNGTAATSFYWIEENISKGCLLSPEWVPTISPSSLPSVMPSEKPTQTDSNQPSLLPTIYPSPDPSTVPSAMTSQFPSKIPSLFSSLDPSNFPSIMLSNSPTFKPSKLPSVEPTLLPTLKPSVVPSINPSTIPSILPTALPSHMPSTTPAITPSLIPSQNTFSKPSFDPSNKPSLTPSSIPSKMPTSLYERDFHGKGLCKNGSTGFNCNQCCDAKHFYIPNPNDLDMKNPTCTESSHNLQTNRWRIGTHYRLNNHCEECPSLVYLGIGLVSISTIVIIAIKFNQKDARVYSHIFIALDFFQSVSFIGSLKVAWPTNLRRAIAIISYFNFDLPIDCFIQTTYQWKALSLHILTMVMIIILISTIMFRSCLNFCSLCKVRKKKSGFTKVVFVMFTNLLFLHQLKLLMTSTEAIECIYENNHEDSSYMIHHWICEDINVRNWKYATVAALLWSIYAIIFPIVTLGCLNYLRRYTNKGSIFKKKYWYWIILIMLRKSSMVLIAFFFRKQIVIQIITLAVSFGLSGLSHLIQMPMSSFNLQAKSNCSIDFFEPNKMHFLVHTSLVILILIAIIFHFNWGGGYSEYIDKLTLSIILSISSYLAIGIISSIIYSVFNLLGAATGSRKGDISSLSSSKSQNKREISTTNSNKRNDKFVHSDCRKNEVLLKGINGVNDYDNKLIFDQMSSPLRPIGPFLPEYEKTKYYDFEIS